MSACGPFSHQTSDQTSTDIDRHQQTPPEKHDHPSLCIFVPDQVSSSNIEYTIHLILCIDCCIFSLQVPIAKKTTTRTWFNQLSAVTNRVPGACQTFVLGRNRLVAFTGVMAIHPMCVTALLVSCLCLCGLRVSDVP